MLGLSFAKLVVLVAIVAVVWFGFRWLERRGAVSGRSDARRRMDGRSGDESVVDLERNPKTGAYEPRQRGD